MATACGILTKAIAEQPQNEEQSNDLTRRKEFTAALINSASEYGKSNGFI